MQNTESPKGTWKFVLVSVFITAVVLGVGTYLFLQQDKEEAPLVVAPQLESPQEVSEKNKAAPLLIGISQFGSDEDDTAYGVAVDSTGIYVAGETEGSFYGTNAGEASPTEKNSAPTLGATHTFGLLDPHDGYLAKYSLDGKTVLWSHQFGTEYFETARGVSITEDAVYVAGETEGSLHSDNLGNSDVFLQKYTKDGELVWNKQFGTNKTDEGLWVVSDEERICTGGGTLGVIEDTPKQGDEDIFIRCYNPAGEELWTLQFGSEGFEEALGAAIDEEGIYLVGATGGQIGEGPQIGKTDSWFGHISLDGEILALNQYGSSIVDFGHGITTDADNIYTTGRTEGKFPGEKSFGLNDAFISAHAKNGDETALWQDQYGTANGDASSHITADPKHGIFMIGIMNGKAEKHGEITNTEDAFIRQYSPKGKFLGSTTIESDRYDEARDITIFDGIAYVVGRTGGTLGSENFGAWDSFIVRYELQSK